MANVRLNVYWSQWAWEKREAGKFMYTTEDYKHSSEWLHKVAEIECDLPEVAIPTDETLRSNFITNLRQQQKDIQAKAHVDLNAVEERIQQLLCIEAKEE
jgi:hypothetical protein